jgi:hypothetical protein
VCKDDLSAAAADIQRRAQEMEKLPHYCFPRMLFFFFQKQREMLAASSEDKTIDHKYLESFEMRC